MFSISSVISVRMASYNSRQSVNNVSGSLSGAGDVDDLFAPRELTSLNVWVHCWVTDDRTIGCHVHGVLGYPALLCE